MPAPIGRMLERAMLTVNLGSNSESSFNYLTNAATKYEAKLAKYLAKGKMKKATKVQGILDSIYRRIRAPREGLDTLNKAGIAKGAARVNREGRAETIYLGGFKATLGTSSLSAPIPFEGGAGSGLPTSFRPSKVPAMTFLGGYYGGGELPSSSRRSYGYQIP